MGMYTEIFFRAEVDEYAFTTLRSLSEGRRPGDDPHPLWLDDRCESLPRGGSCYFPSANHFAAEREDFGFGPPSFHASFRGNLKNYDGTIEAFFDWVAPHLADRGFVGYSLYEEDDRPTAYVWDGEQYAGIAPLVKP